ncbi:MAG: LuxR C-terminal-related transcriptional regulator [Nocardioides sp.]
MARSLADLGDTAPLVVATLVECRLARGEVAQARALTDEIVPWQHRTGRVGGVANQTLGDVLAALGDADIAIPRYEAAGVAMADKEDPEDVPWRSALALALVRTGEIAKARTMAVHQVAAARAAGSPYGEALALRGLAVVADSTERIAVLRSARSLVEGQPAARLRAQIDTDLAGLLVLSGAADPDREPRIEEATKLLVTVESFAFREQLWPLWGRAARLLERLGHKPGEAEAADTLTQTQRRVAVLARDGMRNREIADLLGVSVKAVEWHLSHVYRKLNIRSRTELATALGA